MNKWLGEPSHPCSPEDEGPKGVAQPLLAVCLPLTGALCSSLRTRQVPLDGGTGRASGQPAQVCEHALWSLMLEPVQHALQPGGGQSASCCLHGLPNLIDVFGGMGKIQDAHGIGTLVVDQSRPPLRPILHGAHLCRPFHPAPMRFDQGRFRKALGGSQPRKSGNLLRRDLPALIAGDLPQHERFDFDPLAPGQVDHRSIRTRAFACRLPLAPGGPPV